MFEADDNRTMEEEFNQLPEELMSTPQQPSGGRRLMRFLREVLETVLPAILIAVLINIFVGQATRVDGQSMEPNLYSEQRLVVEKLSYRFHGPNRFDIVVLKMPEHSDTMLIKRVIGLPGETIEIRDGHVYVNGDLLEEAFTTEETHPGRFGEITVPPLHIYVLGDNRDRSNDSRSFGPVAIDNVVGRAWLSYWPPEQVGMVH
jgi:signal peptidase I